ncbi:probable G-protein coupled receptor 146 isoform X3 [Numida meleagris]|uniref:probable G-protein coupled receptor 146 isoform X3 n=1 Tax=Numida meleagris TaxID=8996 RepID=UPI000B3DBC35|nr:probable G-protein coupled receptor 146 isoform X3 [Numida meleagris]
MQCTRTTTLCRNKPTRHVSQHLVPCQMLHTGTARLQLSPSTRVVFSEKEAGLHLRVTIFWAAPHRDERLEFLLSLRWKGSDLMEKMSLPAIKKQQGTAYQKSW